MAKGATGPPDALRAVGTGHLARSRAARAGGRRGSVVPVTTISTLSVDCGGGGIKASVLDAAGAIVSRAVRTPTPYPLRAWPSSCPGPTG